MDTQIKPKRGRPKKIVEDTAVKLPPVAVTLAVHNEVETQTGESIIDALNKFKPKFVYKSKGVITAYKDNRVASRMVLIPQMKRMFNHPVTRQLFAKQLELFLR